MFGYVIPEKNELKIREYEVYGAYYCAICHSIRDRFGQIPRLLLTFDSVFLALVHGALFDSFEEFSTFRCFVNPTKKKHVLSSNPSIEYAADIMLALGYFHLKDDKQDDGGVIASIGESYLRRYYRKIRSVGGLSGKLEKLEGYLSEISQLEKIEETNIDKIAEPFGRLMEVVMDFPNEEFALSEEHREALKKIGYHLGRWIYIIDAVDDLKRDLSDGSYNPLKGKLTGLPSTILAEDGDRDRLGFALRMDLSEISKGLSSLPLKRNRDIIENIVYVGMNNETDRILAKCSSGEEDRKKRKIRIGKL